MKRFKIDIERLWVPFLLIVICMLVAAYADFCHAADPSCRPNGVATPQVYDYSAGAAGTYYLDVPTLSANDTFVGQNTADTLTNKLLTTPTITFNINTYTASKTLTASECKGSMASNYGATSQITLTLAPAVKGMSFAYSQASYKPATITPTATDVIITDTTTAGSVALGTTAGIGVVTTGPVATITGTSAVFVSPATGKWIMYNKSGTWRKYQ